jgi:hypothetical protein
MKIGYKEILELYAGGDEFFICHALRNAFGDDINSNDFVKAVGVDLYGPVHGRLKYWLKCLVTQSTGGALEFVYPGIQRILGPDADGVLASGRDFRLDLLDVLAASHPERKFEVQYFL